MLFEIAKKKIVLISRVNELKPPHAPFSLLYCALSLPIHQQFATDMDY